MKVWTFTGSGRLTDTKLIILFTEVFWYQMKGYCVPSSQLVPISLCSRIGKEKNRRQYWPRVAPRKPCVLPHFLNAELLRPITSWNPEEDELRTLQSCVRPHDLIRHYGFVLLTHKLSKAPQRKPAGSCDKLHESQSHFVVHLFDQLQRRRGQQTQPSRNILEEPTTFHSNIKNKINKTNVYSNTQRTCGSL